MKLAAVAALAALAKRDVPEVVSDAYGRSPFTFGREYLIPKPLDPRALVEVEGAVAMSSAVSVRRARVAPGFFADLGLLPQVGRTFHGDVALTRGR